MKKLLTILLFFSVAGLVTAKDIKEYEYSNSNKNLKIEYSNKNRIPYRLEGKENQVQELPGDSVLFIDYNMSFRHFVNNTTPVSYDPASNLFVMADLFVDGDSIGLQTSNIYIIRTTNNGSKWDSLTVYFGKDRGPAYPSIALTNPTKSSDISDVNYITYGRQILKRSDDGKQLVQKDVDGGGIFSYYSKSIGGQIFSEYSAKPTLGGISNHPQVWGNLKFSTVPESDYYYAYGMLSPEGKNSKYGYYGFWGFDFEHQVPVSNSPLELQDNLFNQTGNDSTSYNSKINCGIDNDKNLYLVINNEFVDNDLNRFPSFTKSTDNGQTWSVLEKFPSTVYSDFINKYKDESGDLEVLFPGSTPYQPSQLFVYGNNNFSYFTTVLLVSPNGQTPVVQRYFLVDIRYNNGVWSLDALEELNSEGPSTFSRYGDRNDNTKYDLSYNSGFSTSFGICLQESKTADGENLVLYWIDSDGNKYRTFNSPYKVWTTRRNQLSGNIENVQIDLDSLPKFDIYAKIYNIKTNTWGNKINITNDDATDYFFHVPEYIRSTKEAIIVTYDVVKVTNPKHPLFGVPMPINEAITDIPHYVRPSFFDLNNIPSVSSVNDKLNFNVSLNNAYPNPAINTNNVEISFNMEKSSKISLNLYDNIGNKVATILNNHYAVEGNNAINYNISNLNSGTYFYQLSVSGYTFTKKLMIVK